MPLGSLWYTVQYIASYKREATAVGYMAASKRMGFIEAIQAPILYSVQVIIIIYGPWRK